MDFLKLNEFCILIQARTNSTRFPNKIMADLDGTIILKHVIKKCMFTQINTCCVIPTNDIVAKYLDDINVPYFEGPENDVLARYYKALSEHIKANVNIIRITSDCPMVSPVEILGVVGLFLLYDLDFVSNVDYNIDGQDVEIISPRLLHYVHENAKKKEHREHVTLYIKDNYMLLRNEGFKVFSFCGVNDPETSMKMSVDTPEDLERIRKFCAKRKKYMENIIRDKRGVPSE